MSAQLRCGAGWNRTFSRIATHRLAFSPTAAKRGLKKMKAVAGDGDFTSVGVSCSEEGKLLAIKKQLEKDTTISNVRFDFSNSVFPAGTAGQSKFDIKRYHEQLSTSILGTTLLTAAEIPSTQDFLRNSISTWPDGTAIVADSQTAGKGRRENQWSSPAGCLMFSFVKSLRISGGLAPFLNYVVCLAIVEALQEISLNTFSDSSVKFRIKWPNDIYYDGLKIGGVLLHASWKSSGLVMHIGVGLNVFNRQPTICLHDIFSKSSRKEKSEGGLFSEEILARVFNHMESLFEIMEREGFGPMEERYLKYWLHSDQSVQVKSSEEEKGSDTGPMSVTIKGISPQGFLLAVSDAGEMLELQPDGNSLDMMHGLIHRRL
ncbi:hypothetical protein BSKO_13797 [Bryopsis sp. KO-2023]|nr:hypothetical protein BSKO_13797 [Bryopsis sp. KO-2023]